MTMKIEQPVLPYREADGTATQGHSGSDTSRDRAVREAADGTAAKRQQKVLAIMRMTVGYGVTVTELRDTTGWHHGQASATLSSLHKGGVIDRLEVKRNRCHVYVLPEHVNERPTQPHGRRKPDTEQFTQEDIDAARGEGYTSGLLDGRRDGMKTADEQLLTYVNRVIKVVKQGQPARQHSSGCYRRHPECALRAVANAIEKGGAMT